MGPAAKQEPEIDRVTASFISSERSGLTTAEVRCRPFCADETVTCATASPPHSTSNALENPAADMKANAQTHSISQPANVRQVFFLDVDRNSQKGARYGVHHLLFAAEDFRSDKDIALEERTLRDASPSITPMAPPTPQ